MVRLEGESVMRINDSLAIEAPLTVELVIGDSNHSLGLTMRTPGDDEDLIVGMLYSESIIDGVEDILSVEINSEGATVQLSDNVCFDINEHARSTTKTAACGVCGKKSLNNLRHFHGPPLSEDIHITRSIISSNSASSKAAQTMFSKTGGSHAAAAFTEQGQLICIREDVGRHNAMDKLIGALLRTSGKSPKPHSNNDQSRTIVHLSGRSSFELVQKAVRAGFPLLSSVGAASSLAVDLARENNLSLIAFVRDESMVIHSAPFRVVE
ncbi:formate dehydrogenase accessory sulfurtransferase FdhD [bacterium]|nr:formate dehydrogenase accessory sulfurtransferase FdhD [bacterium]